ncbi:MAG: UDP-N-acetylglucosamine 2-epimerase [Candidatus Marinimicrobia bacterium]|nr:UDP-N-acetylglucosamine 2-epimerase [Candidatus Neomarinimicrobiota bacterium]MDA1363876.1 UDP-N-acetylglucosamine 2-epimerase [Candidatus Neomarinimicrobiota bacterium]|tara:strand:+ start:1501 stop:2712 length:1212 start_codon:yes stop_codon:yes gene_type:complete
MRKIAIFTGNRAEYGLQFPILRAVKKHPDLEHKLLVSGAHLDKNFGKTLQEIRSDGFEIDAEIKIEMDAKTLFATAQAIGSGILEISKVLAKMKPDIMVVYADRFEGLAAVIASSQMNIPTAHIEGGDITEGGALDDSVRHAMTKLSHIHFTTNQEASNRILGLGEEEWRVHTVGFPAIDLISENNFATKDEIVSELDLDLNKPIILFTQHSVTTEFDQSVDQINPCLEGLARLSNEDIQIIITYPNNDAGGKQIIQRINEFSESSNSNIQVHRSLGRYLYHGILSLSEQGVRVACVGNSSSGLKETPAFSCPTVNIGSRQDGRLRGVNVIDCDYSSSDLQEAIKKCLFDENFRDLCRKGDNPYWMGDAGPKIAKVLAEIDLNQDLIRKKMTLKGNVKDGWFQ